MGIYIVQPGDSLTSIAKEKLGDANRAREIASMNHLRDLSQIYPGQKLQIPRQTPYQNLPTPDTNPLSIPLTKPQSSGPVRETVPNSVNPLQSTICQSASLYLDLEPYLTQPFVLLNGYCKPRGMNNSNLFLYLVLRDEGLKYNRTSITKRFAKDDYQAKDKQIDEAAKLISNETEKADKEAENALVNKMNEEGYKYQESRLKTAEQNVSFYSGKIFILPVSLSLPSAGGNLNLSATKGANSFIDIPDSEQPEAAYLNAIESLEGFRNYIYTDSHGFATTGLGWLLQAGTKSAQLINFKDMGDNIYHLTDESTNTKLIEFYSDKSCTKRATEGEIQDELTRISKMGADKNLDGELSRLFLKRQYIIDKTLGMVISHAKEVHKLNGFDTYPLPAQMALIDMTYNIGPYFLNRSATFKTTVENQEWEKAIGEQFSVLTEKTRNSYKSGKGTPDLRRLLARAQWFLMAQKIKDAGS